MATIRHTIKETKRLIREGRESRARKEMESLKSKNRQLKEKIAEERELSRLLAKRNKLKSENRELRNPISHRVGKVARSVGSSISERIQRRTPTGRPSKRNFRRVYTRPQPNQVRVNVRNDNRRIVRRPAPQQPRQKMVQARSIHDLDYANPYGENPLKDIFY